MRSLLTCQAILSALLIAAPATAANREDAALNSVYADLAAARERHDVAAMSGAFGPEGILIDARPGPAITGAELAQRLKPMADRIRSDGVNITTAYRIERRSVMGDIVVDAGYMRQKVTRPDGQASTRFARFLVTMRRSGNGTWQIIGDASMPAEEAQFSAVAKQGGLHHDL
jgi:ketosteroid isomerase-like protein